MSISNTTLRLDVEKTNKETLDAILMAKAKAGGTIPNDTPGFTDSKKLIAYMKKRAKELE